MKAAFGSGFGEQMLTGPVIESCSSSHSISRTKSLSWIHESDLVRAIEWLLEHDSITGPVNICSPNPLPNAAFMATLREAWGISFGLPATPWMLELGALALRTETELILKSRRVIPGFLQ